MEELSQAAKDLNWLINNFVDQVPKVAHAVVLSSDGLVLAYSDGLARDRADQLAAVACGLASLTVGAAKIFDGGPIAQTIVEMKRGFLFVMQISDGSVFAVMAAPECDMGLVGYQMTLVVERTGDVLTPSLREELQAALPKR